MAGLGTLNFIGGRRLPLHMHVGGIRGARHAHPNRESAPPQPFDMKVESWGSRLRRAVDRRCRCRVRYRGGRAKLTGPRQRQAEQQHRDQYEDVSTVHGRPPYDDVMWRYGLGRVTLPTASPCWHARVPTPGRDLPTPPRDHFSIANLKTRKATTTLIGRNTKK